MDDKHLAIQAYNEMRASGELAAARNKKVEPARPTLDDVLNELGPLPPEALFLGMAEDGLPVLLNLHNSVPGPLLVIGDERAGKTTLLKTIAETVSRTLNSLQNSPQAYHDAA